MFSPHPWRFEVTDRGFIGRACPLFVGPFYIQRLSLRGLLEDRSSRKISSRPFRLPTGCSTSRWASASGGDLGLCRLCSSEKREGIVRLGSKERSIEVSAKEGTRKREEGCWYSGVGFSNFGGGEDGASSEAEVLRYLLVYLGEMLAR